MKRLTARGPVFVIALVALGSYEAALSPLGRAVAEAAGDRAILAEAYRGLGVAWRRRGDLDKAIRELRKAVAEDGADADARARSLFPFCRQGAEVGGRGCGGRNQRP